jgi:RNA 3'-terminal phosphate cyclase (ATP)
MSIIEIDGSYGEGGGQVLRTSMSLAAILGESIRICNIRSKRQSRGLQPQHLMACKAAAEVSNGLLEGSEKNSSELFFVPSKITGGNYTFDIGTAGTTILVAQTLIPILLYAAKPSIVRIIGGTHLPQSPSYDYFEHVFLPAIKRFGAEVNAQMIQPGYYPAGGGMIELKISPSKLIGNSDWKVPDTMHALIRSSKLREEKNIGEREASILLEHGVQDIRLINENALSPANALTLWSGFRGACILGEKGKLAEKVAEELWNNFKNETGEVDAHLADQLLIYACLAKKKTSYSAAHHTFHLETNADIIRHFLKKKVSFMGKSVHIE